MTDVEARRGRPRGLARWPRRRRVAAAVVVAVVALAAAGVAVAALAGGDGDGGVVAGRDGAGERPGGQPPGLELGPATGLADGDVVTLRPADDPGGELVARQCGREVADGDGAPGEWCGRTEYLLRSPAGRPDLTMPVARALATPQGTLDCGEEAGRCVVALRPADAGPGAGDRPEWSAGLAFGPAPPAQGPALAVDGRPRNGDAVTVSGTGYPAGDRLLLRQCLGEDASAPCDQARVASVAVGDDGSFEAPFVVSAEALTGEGWQPCEPCHLQTLGDLSAATASGPLTVEAAGEPVRPAVSVAGAPPHAPGAAVTIEGTGFQAGAAGIAVGTCAVPPGTASGDVPAGGPPACGYPPAGFVEEAPTADGTFRIEGYPLPPAGAPCLAAGSRCALAWYPEDGGPAAFVTLLEVDDGG
jgi:hypothetical protein